MGDMSGHLTTWELDPEQLLAPAIASAVAPQGTAAFACEVVRVVAHPDDLEDPEGGLAPEEVGAVMALFAHAFAQGVFSSRQIAVLTEQRLDFLAIAGGAPMPFRTLMSARDRLAPALARVLARWIAVADKAGYFPAEDHPGRTAARWVETSRAMDAEEDAAFGEEHVGLRPAPWLGDARARERRLRAAIEVLTDPHRKNEPDEDKRPLIRAHSRNSTDIIEAYPGQETEPWEEEPEPEPEPEPPPRPRERVSARQARGGAAAEVAPAAPAPAPPAQAAPAPAAAEGPASSTGAAAAVEIIRHVKDPEDRLRLVEVALGAAVADGDVTPAEQRRIQALVRFLRFDEAQKARLVKLMRTGQAPPMPNADDVPDYEVRVFIFEQAATMALVDGRPNERELAYLREVAQAFELTPGDVKAAIARAQSGAA